MPPKKLTYEEFVERVCRDKRNMTVDEVVNLLGRSPSQVYQFASQGKLATVKLGNVIVFPRAEVLRFKRQEMEVEITKKLAEGMHPLDIYFEADGRYPMREVDRVLREWAKLTGVWLVEAPRGSFARWLSRMGLTAVNPRLMRRFIEAMLTDPEIAPRARAYFVDRRQFNGSSEEKLAERARYRKRSLDALDVEDAP